MRTMPELEPETEDEICLNAGNPSLIIYRVGAETANCGDTPGTRGPSMALNRAILTLQWRVFWRVKLDTMGRAKYKPLKEWVKTEDPT